MVLKNREVSRLNIFFVDEDPVVAASMLCDRHVLKMVIETAQILCTGVRVHGGDAPYKRTHVNHPCSVWARFSTGNWDWTVRHARALCNEYTKRYGKVHGCEKVVSWLESNRPKDLFDAPMSRPVLAMPEKYKDQSDPVGSYRRFYLSEKMSFARWNHGPTPEWVRDREPSRVE